MDTMSPVDLLKAFRRLGWSHPLSVEARHAASVVLAGSCFHVASWFTGNAVYSLASLSVFLTWDFVRKSSFEVGRMFGKMDAELELEQKGKVE